MMTTVGGAVTTKGGGPGTPVLTPAFTSLAAAIPVPIPIAATAATNQTFGAMASSRAPGKCTASARPNVKEGAELGDFPQRVMCRGGIRNEHLSRCERYSSAAGVSVLDYIER